MMPTESNDDKVHRITIEYRTGMIGVQTENLKPDEAVSLLLKAADMVSSKPGDTDVIMKTYDGEYEGPGLSQEMDEIGKMMSAEGPGN